MSESNCYRCGEEVESTFDICWNCGTVLRTSPALDEPKEPPAAESTARAPRQFRLWHLFLWTTIAAVLAAVFTSALAPHAATAVFLIGIWLSIGVVMALFMVALVYLSTSSWSPFGLWRFLDLVEDEKRSDDGVPVDVWHQRQQLAQQNDAAPHDR